LDGGSCNVGVESTVVDGLGWDPVTGGVLKLLRPGGVGVERLEEIVRQVEQDCGMDRGSTIIWVHGKQQQDLTDDGDAPKSNVASNPSKSGASLQIRKGIFTEPRSTSPDCGANEFPSTPGMKYKHYSPSVPVFLLLPTSTFQTPPAELAPNLIKPVSLRQVMDRIASSVFQEQCLPSCTNGVTRRKARLGLMHFEDSPTVNALHTLNRAQPDSSWEVSLLSLGRDAEDAARELFGGMLHLEGRRRQALNDGTPNEGVPVSSEEGGVDAILIEGCPDAGLGLAVMERVRKAVGGGGKGFSLTTSGERSTPSSFWVDVE